MFETVDDAAKPVALGRVKTCKLLEYALAVPISDFGMRSKIFSMAHFCETAVIGDVPRKREPFTTQLMLRMRSLYAICTAMHLSDQGYRHSSMKPIREARRTAALMSQSCASNDGSVASLDHVERRGSASNPVQPQSPTVDEDDDVCVSDDDVDVGAFPAQNATRPQESQPVSTRMERLQSNQFIKHNALGVMQRPQTPLKWATGEAPVDFWISRILMQHYAPMVWLKMAMMGKNWRRRCAEGELSERVVTKSGYISRQRMMQRLREIWDQFSPNCPEFQQWFFAKLTYEDYLHVDQKKARRDRIVHMFSNCLKAYPDRGEYVA